jgi:transcriptional regulator
VFKTAASASSATPASGIVAAGDRAAPIPQRQRGRSDHAIASPPDDATPTRADGRPRAILGGVYIPDHFRPTDDDVAALLANIGAAELITATADGLLATMLPLIHEPAGPAGPAAGPHGRLMGHVARNNRQWAVSPIGEAMAIVRGPDAYISPAWYATKREHGRVVPTWNYITAHVHGELVVHDDPAWVEANVRALSNRHEAARPVPWSVDDAPLPYIAGQLRAIVGVEILISRIEAKFKLSQNRSTEDVDGAIAGLAAEVGPSASAMTRAMRAVRERR